MTQEAKAQMSGTFYHFLKGWAAEELEINTTFETMEERKEAFMAMPRGDTVVVQSFHIGKLYVGLSDVWFRTYVI